MLSKLFKKTFRFSSSVEEKCRFIIVFSSLLSIFCLENLVPIVGHVSHYYVWCGYLRWDSQKSSTDTLFKKLTHDSLQRGSKITFSAFSLWYFPNFKCLEVISPFYSVYYTIPDHYKQEKLKNSYWDLEFQRHPFIPRFSP